MKKLTKTEAAAGLSGLDGWQIAGENLTKDFKFKDFATAMDFINRLAVVADKKLNHHPDWRNSYNRVSISLTSHEAGGLTDKDFSLAQAADEIAAEL